MRIFLWLNRTPFAVGMAIPILVAGLMIFMVPRFVEVFSSFGVDLPAHTLFFVKYYWASLIFPFVVFVVWKYWPYQTTRSIMMGLLGVIGPIVFLLLAIWAMYSPIFKCSCVTA